MVYSTQGITTRIDISKVYVLNLQAQYYMEAEKDHLPAYYYHSCPNSSNSISYLARDQIERNVLLFRALAKMVSVKFNSNNKGAGQK